jgi:acyl-CoA synthetase (AMP-forming)/AMP-acid ligase II
MPASDLQSLLQERAANQELWVTDPKDWTVAGVLASTECAASWSSGLGRKGIALAGTSHLFFAWGLCLLDGVAASVFLVPSGLPASTLQTFCAQAAINHLACEDGHSPPQGLETLERLTLPPLVSTHSTTVATGERASRVTTRWLLATSGTTGTPKLVPHTLGSLTRTAKRDLKRGAELRWGLLYEMTRFAGVQVFLQALAGGSSLAIPRAGLPLPETVEFLREKRCNALSATPTLWRKLLMIPGSDQLNLRLITLGGEIADDNILRALKAAYPGAALRHIYASTEAGVGFTVGDGQAGFPAAFLKDGPEGIRLRIRTEDQMLLIQPGLETPRTYIDRETRITDDEGWVETGDIVQQQGDRILFLGRANGAINVGGSKVHPTEVEAVLRQLPWVAEALVRGKKSPFTGNLVEAFITIRRAISEERSSAALAEEAREHCRARLEPFKIPALVHISDELPVTSTGKLSRTALKGMP